MKILKTDKFSEKLKIKPVRVEDLNSTNVLFNKNDLDTGTVVRFADGSYGMFVKVEDMNDMYLKKTWPKENLFLTNDNDNYSHLCYLRLSLYSDDLTCVEYPDFCVDRLYKEQIDKSVYMSYGFADNFYEIVHDFVIKYPNSIKRYEK